MSSPSLRGRSSCAEPTRRRYDRSPSRWIRTNRDAKIISEEAIDAINARGGLDRIIISHPHFYASMVEWSEAFGGVPILLHEADRRWIQRPHPSIELWSGDELSLSGSVRRPTVRRRAPTSPGVAKPRLSELLERAPFELGCDAEQLLLRKPLAIDAGGAEHGGEDAWGNNLYPSKQDPSWQILFFWATGAQP